MFKKLMFVLLLISSFAAAQSKPVVVVELFTSEGCSSCPPADALFRDLQVRGFPGTELVLLGEHVDYWNHLGWKDSFSSAQFTARQREYVSKLKISDGYTPQAVVDGRVEFVGSDEEQLRRAITNSAKASKPLRLDLLWDGKTQTAHISAEGEGAGDLYVAFTETGLTSEVTAGENVGNRLTHAAVVRRLVNAGHVQGAFSKDVHQPLDRSWNPKHFKVAAFVQDANSAAILGATSLPLLP